MRISSQAVACSRRPASAGAKKYHIKIKSRSYQEALRILVGFARIRSYCESLRIANGQPRSPSPSPGVQLACGVCYGQEQLLRCSSHTSPDFQNILYLQQCQLMLVRTQSITRNPAACFLSRSVFRSRRVTVQRSVLRAPAPGKGNTDLGFVDRNPTPKSTKLIS